VKEAEVEQLFNQFVDGFGLSSAHVIVLLVVISLVSQVVGRLIPDDATGLLGVIRQIAKVLGLYVSNRVSSGISVNDTARQVVREQLPERVAEIEQRAILKPFPDAEVHVSTRGKDGKFAKLESPWFVTALIFVLLLPLMLGGCATAGAGSQVRPALQLDAAAGARDQRDSRRPEPAAGSVRPAGARIGVSADLPNRAS
jgi:hypothetical protein